MPRRSRTVAVALWLLALPLAGCAGPADDPGAGDRPDLGPAPEPTSCSTGNRTQWAGGFQEPHTDRVRLCWRNGNATTGDSSPFYFVALRDRGQGFWAVTVRDGAGDTFLDLEFGPGRNYECDDQGRRATPGNWSIDVRYWNVTGNPTLRIDADEPDDWQCAYG